MNFKGELQFTFFLLILCSLQGFRAHCQSNYQKGYVVMNNSDTLRGYIDQKEWIRNPHAISFQKERNNASPREFTLRDIVYFEIEGRVSFERYTVNISMDKVSLENLGVPMEQGRMDTVFLRILQSGRFVKLFSYRDNLKTRYYLLDSKISIPEELIYRIYSQTYDPDRYSDIDSRALTFVTDDRYKDQLLAAAQDARIYSEKLNWQIKKSSYARESLLDIVSRINVVSKTARAIERKIALACYVSSGFNKSALNYSNGGVFTKSSASYSSPFFSVGINVLGNREAGRIILRGEISWSTAKFHTVAQYTVPSTYPLRVDYTFSQRTVSHSLHFLYCLYNSPNLKFYLGTGIRVNLSVYPNDLYTATTTYETNPLNANVSKTVDFFRLNKGWYSGVLQAGIIFFKRVEITGSYNLGSGLNRNESLWSESINSARVGASYYVWKK